MIDRCLFGALYVKDERVKAGIDHAGNLSFVFMMALTWAWMVIGLLLKETNVLIPSGVLFLASSVFYIVQLIRSGAAYTAPEMKDRPMTAIICFAVGALVYWSIITGLEIYALMGKTAPLPLGKIMVKNAAQALVWITFLAGLLTIVTRINRRRIDKRIEKD
jgi:hypothetical protein